MNTVTNYWIPFKQIIFEPPGLFTVESGFNPRIVYVGFVVDKIALGQILLRKLWSSLGKYHFTNVIYSFTISSWYKGSHTRTQFQNTQSHHIPANKTKLKTRSSGND
jgi:hypothetical protein